MKAKVIKEDVFVPVTIQLTFDTKDELDAFGTLFNHSTIAAVVRDVSGSTRMPEVIYLTVTNAGGTVNNVEAVTSSLNERGWFRK